jgi:hypothetical protein
VNLLEELKPKAKKLKIWTWVLEVSIIVVMTAGAIFAFDHGFLVPGIICFALGALLIVAFLLVIIKAGKIMPKVRALEHYQKTNDILFQMIEKHFRGELKALLEEFGLGVISIDYEATEKWFTENVHSHKFSIYTAINNDDDSVRILFDDKITILVTTDDLEEKLDNEMEDNEFDLNARLEEGKITQEEYDRIIEELGNLWLLDDFDGKKIDYPQTNYLNGFLHFLKDEINKEMKRATDELTERIEQLKNIKKGQRQNEVIG